MVGLDSFSCLGCRWTRLRHGRSLREAASHFTADAVRETGAGIYTDLSEYDAYTEEEYNEVTHC